MEIRSSNPVLNQKFWSNLTGNDRMTIDGSMRKIGYLLGLTVVSALVSAVLCLNAINNGNGGLYIGGFMTLGFLGGFVIAMVVFVSRPKNPAALMSLYAILEGMAVGAMSLALELTAYKGIALQAVFGTMAITGTMYIMYTSRIIRPTPAFNKIVGGLVISIMFLYLTSFILQVFSGYDVPFLHSSGPIGIGVTAFILVVAALTLISDFGFIESGTRYGAPKNMEWYAAFGILISLIWIYIETLRLLAKLQAFRE
ncbi:MAG: Bax inhibitor-1/YccA family protein [Poseidonia sp.]